MKIRWREHEMIFVTVLVAAQTIFSLYQLYSPSHEQWGTRFAAAFKEKDIPFIYWRNVLIPQVASVLLVYLGYLSVNLLIIPSVKKISFNDVEKLFTFNILKSVLVIVLVGYSLAIGVNAVSYYARPHLLNYAGYQLLALLGYNDKPLTDLFFGFGRATGLVLLFTALAGVRELIIGFIGKPGATREFRVMITNNVTPLLVVYLLIPFFTNPLHDRFMDYLAWTTPILALYIYHTFWLFPFGENHRWRERPVLFRLLTSTFAGALFFTLVFSGAEKLWGLLLYWILLLLVITPLTWLLYRQRKDSILQLKGLEAALARSTTDLQFLRSQINPHFLFNALNALYGTAVKERSEQTAAGIQMLGDMMRFMLHDNNLDLIPMNKEIEYLKNYIALQKLRIPSSSGITIEDNIEEVCCNRQIAPMLLIPFVENAFKHGISFKERSWIDIKLECTEARVCFEVRNSRHRHVESNIEKDSPGIGLKNVAGRLKLLYAGKHQLKVSEDENEFTATLVIE
jgi:hypothetical protein